MIEKYFKVEEKGSSIKTELIAGLTTFLTMAYILPVNTMMLSEAGMPANSVFMATALSSAIASILMGVLSNYPVALAPGMGVNALFTYTIVQGFGLSYKAALAAVFISGIVFVLASVTPVRALIIKAIPVFLQQAIGAGIGFFIASLGLKNAGIIVASDSTVMALGNLKDPAVLLAIAGLAFTLLLLVKGVYAAVFYGLISTAVVGLILGSMGIEGMPLLPDKVFQFDLSMPTAFAFLDGFQELFSSGYAFITLFTFIFVDFFDTAGTLVAVAHRIDMIDENGELKGGRNALLGDALGCVIGATLGTSTVTAYVESTAGVAAGGKTGLTSVTTGVLFALSIFISPLLMIVTNSVTAPALIVVGILMSQSLGEINWDDIAEAVPSFITIIMMMLTSSIADGMALGFIAYTIVTVATGKIKETNFMVWILFVVFILYFLI